MLRSVNIDCQRTRNMYPEFDEMGQDKQRKVAALIGTPGLRLLLTLSASPIRGLYFASNSTLYAAAGNTLYSISSTWVATSLGSLSSSSGPVSMTDNGTLLAIVDGSYGYTLNMSTNVFAQITDADFHGGARVAFVDGYFAFNWPDTNKFYISDLYAGTFDPLDFGTAEGVPDRVVSVLADHRELWVFGKRHTEVFFNSGDLFPFSRVSGGLLEHGCSAAQTPQKLGNTVFWVGRDERGGRVVWRARGYVPERVSTHAVEIALQSYGDLSGGEAYAYEQDGHGFYCLNFPGADTTWVFDTSTGLWHERTYTLDGIQQRHRVQVHTFAYDTNVVGDYQNGKIYAYDLSTYTDNGDLITRQRTAPHIADGLKRVRFNKFQLDMKTGVGLDGSQQGQDPQMMLRFSNDAGHTWSSEYWVSAGLIGQFLRRARWLRMGTARDRVFEWKMTDPVQCILIGAEIDAVVAVS